MKLFAYIGCLVLLAFLPACRTAHVEAAGSAPPEELLDRHYLFEIVRHLYRWQLDESEIERIISTKQLVFWVGRFEARLDPGDRSILGEILLPQLSLGVKVKKADYTIEELGTVVRSQTFRITHVTRGQTPDRAPGNYAVVQVDMKELREYLFRTRKQHDYADPILIERLRGALRAEAAKEGITNTPSGEQVVHLAPLSPVANECWVFWESGHNLFYFASDIDLSNPAVWQHEALLARIFHVDDQTVESREEAPGSGRFLTRYEVSRALFNCIILGQRVVLPPRPPRKIDEPK